MWPGSGYRGSSAALVLVVGLFVPSGPGLNSPSRRMEIQPAARKPDQFPPIGQFLTISGTVYDSVLARLTAAALALRPAHCQEKRSGIWVLEDPARVDPFHQSGWPRFLSS